ncbi:MAG: hypothetical protein ACI835_001671 [Planctomycetota bacterium]|jgi:hypothetical protein
MRVTLQSSHHRVARLSESLPMTRSLIASAAVLMLAASCTSPGQSSNNHWSNASTVPRATRFFLGYDSEKDGDYRDFAWKRKQDINLTLRRHFMHHNPDNPNHDDVKSRYEPRPNHSILPNPVNYIHVEGVLLGFAVGAGIFPLDSLFGTFHDGGFDEMVLGVQEFFTPIGSLTSSIMHNTLEPAVGGTVNRLHKYVMPEKPLLD